MTYRSEPIKPLFSTLLEAGFRECEHPRVVGAQCQDCGAVETVAGQFMGGSTQFKRLPYDNEWREKRGKM